MIIRIDPASAVPLFEQIVRAVRSEILGARLAAGDRLPSARELATSLDINLHTVLRAYQELREEGLIELRRGRGAVVIGGPDLGVVQRIIAELGSEARSRGLASDTVIALVREELSR
ncbi:GntR family transcriptional regulator [Leifsonia flava]|uniref:GntR family transcriptional regulator n=1 Tax=Orlajensenia leifsoniae TaxID=2561933 RepID=A0A4Y9QXQ3_9MICO|nr:GntR family transcriptional regulator [Leifsonia flava]TFV96890.1 GntR family transcriptional regulator [Leifsonia flava]